LRDREDQELRGLFRHLQNQDQRQIPDFGTLMARAREEASRSGLEALPGNRASRRLPRRLAWGGSFLAAAAMATLLLVQPPGTSESEFVQVVQTFSSNPASGAWESPTDALLDFPGKELLTTVPSISSRRWLLDPSGNPRRNEL